MATNLTPLIAQLMAERGQTQGAALSQIGLSLGQIPEQMSREREQEMREQQLAMQTQMGGLQMQQMRRQEANAALVDRTHQAISGFMNDPTMWNEDGTTLNARAITQRMTQPDQTGQVPSYDMATVYNTVDGINQSLGTARDKQLQYQESKANARAKMAGAALMLGDKDGNYFTHAQAMMAAAQKSGVFTPDEVHQQAVEFVEHPEDIKNTLQGYVAQSTLPPLKTAEGETIRNAAYPSQVLAQGTKKPLVINGQMVDADTHLPIGAPIPMQARPLSAEDAALKRGQLKEIDAKLAGTIPMSEKDRASLQIERARVNEEIRKDTMTADPLGLGLAVPVSPLGVAPGGIGGGLAAHAAGVNAAAGGPPVAGGGVVPPAAGVTPPAAAGAVPPTTGVVPTTGGAAIKEAFAKDLHGDDFLKVLPSSLAAQVSGLAKGNILFPTGAAARAPYWQQMIDLVGQYDPSFDASTGPARFALRKDLTSTNGKGGQSIIAINRALEHGGNLSDDIEALNNLPFEDLNKGINWIKNKFGSSAVKNYETDRDAFSNEMERLFRGSSGSTADIEHLKEHLDQAEGQQAQRDVLNHYFGLLRGQSNSLEQQRDNGMGPVAGKAIPIIFDKNLPTFDKVGKRARGETVSSSVVNPGTPTSGEWDFNPATGKIEQRKD